MPKRFSEYDGFSGIYVVTGPDGEYIGVGANLGYALRSKWNWLQNGKKCLIPTIKFIEAWKKYGPEAFEWAVLKLCSKENLQVFKAFYIKDRRSKDLTLYNDRASAYCKEISARYKRLWNEGFYDCKIHRGSKQPAETIKTVVALYKSGQDYIQIAKELKLDHHTIFRVLKENKISPDSIFTGRRPKYKSISQNAGRIRAMHKEGSSILCLAKQFDAPVGIIRNVIFRRGAYKK
jgi:hypothetical protein